MRALLASFLVLISGACYSAGFGATSQALPGAKMAPEFLPVEQAYQLEVEIIDGQNIRVYWQIAPNYYLYQHRFDFNLETDQGAVDLSVDMPAALSRNDEYFGEVEVYYQNADINLQLQRASERGILSVTSQGCADAGLCYPPFVQKFDLDFSSSTVTPATQLNTDTQTVAVTAQDSSTGDGLLYMLLLAFMGGVILNLMPCVFPILSLKVLSFARSTDHDRHLHSWIYTAGVISSFVFVAALLIALQQAGSAIGWGFQLQSPVFVIALAYLFVAMGLSLSGLVEMGGSLMNTGSGLANRGGLSGSFFTGVLAVIVASPCTAPFMGTALGFAVSQPPHIGLLVFAALGAGMAAPLLLFSYSGAARALMPKPGAWMETLKQLLAFPLYATAIWLLWVAGRQTGVNTMTAALSGVLMLALGLWLWQHSWWRRALAVACLMTAVGLGSMRELDVRTGDATQLAQGKFIWSEAAVAEQRRAGNPVFVDVTAAWCITCIANETAVLFTDDIEQAFADYGVVYMVADWTNHNADIAALLERYGRNGIPLYLMYAADTSEAPLILPQLLTAQTVIDALQAVSEKKTDIKAIF
ncbi:MAG: protein-disulfide reductase DsbD [Halioglobus sp.]|nr:protein-disulfide reductase DsbD [Halioglobus sp.]